MNNLVIERNRHNSGCGRGNRAYQEKLEKLSKTIEIKLRLMKIAHMLKTMCI